MCPCYFCHNATGKIAAAEPIEIFLDVIAPSPEVITVGGVHIAITLTQIGKVMS